MCLSMRHLHCGDKYKRRGNSEYIVNIDIENIADIENIGMDYIANIVNILLLQRFTRPLCSGWLKKMLFKAWISSKSLILKVCVQNTFTLSIWSSISLVSFLQIIARVKADFGGRCQSSTYVI